ncbi:MAG: acyltransferase [Actinobacteria bacterium]|nr:acyltransferase [Actinomycetota bacterium]
MKIFLAKLQKFGIKRAFIYVLIAVAAKIIVLLYKIIFSDNSPDTEGAIIVQATQFIGKGAIKIKGAQLGVWPSPYLISGCGYIEARSATSFIDIGKSSLLNNNFVIIADRSSIKIGERCLIGPNFFITDSDFHGLEPENRTNGNYRCLPVVIENDVFIGEGVKVMKGVTVGQGSVIGTGSVVVRNIEPFSVYAGVPAQKINDIKVDCHFNY